MRTVLMLVAMAALASCGDEPVAPPDEVPFDSIRTDCVPGKTVVNGQVQFICPDSTSS